MDRLLSMSVFAKAVESGSFSAAGEALRMSSQLVGRHVQTLEQHLGVRLINRTTRRQHLTEAGFAFYEWVKNILAEVEAAEGMAAVSGRTPRGRLRINAPVSFGIHALSRRLPEYLAAYPEVSVDMSLSNRFVDLIDEGFDVAFRVGELSDSGLIARAIACVCAPLPLISPAGRRLRIPTTSPATSASDFPTPSCVRAGLSWGRRARSPYPFPAS